LRRESGVSILPPLESATLVLAIIRSPSMFVHTRRVISLAAVGVALALPHSAGAQSSMFQACSQGSLQTCAMIQLSQQIGVGPGGVNLFQIALQNLGSVTTPSFPSAILLLSFVTGAPAAAPGTEVDALVTPTAQGGATISDNSPWSVFESGDAIFLAALGNDGIGGCAASAPVGGFGQMANTCGPNEFVTFDFFTSRTFDVSNIALADLEWSGIAPGNPGDSCIPGSNCVITATPEPGTMLLALSGLSGLAGMRLRRRSKSQAASPVASEA
jgi:MYXO-CTERM domain-containing protein